MNVKDRQPGQTNGLGNESWKDSTEQNWQITSMQQSGTSLESIEPYKCTQTSTSIYSFGEEGGAGGSKGTSSIRGLPFKKISGSGMRISVGY